MKKKDNKKFYNSKRWKLTRLNQLSNYPLCRHCEKIGRFITARDVDHIVSMESGGHPTDPNNLQSLCHSCHSRKTAREDSGFGNSKSTKPMKGCDTNGLPLDDKHPWACNGGREQS